jgi:hypothetical protein
MLQSVALAKQRQRHHMMVCEMFVNRKINLNLGTDQSNEVQRLCESNNVSVVQKGDLP